jgi:hypothetical protein
MDCWRAGLIQLKRTIFPVDNLTGTSRALKNTHLAWYNKACVPNCRETTYVAMLDFSHRSFNNRTYLPVYFRNCAGSPHYPTTPNNNAYTFAGGPLDFDIRPQLFRPAIRPPAAPVVPVNEYLAALIYIGLGLVGAVVHWGKKRYVDSSTKTSLAQYVGGNLPSTLYALGAIALAEVNLSLLQVGPSITLGALIGALSVGYALDSGFNKSPDALKVGLSNYVEASPAEISKEPDTTKND